MSERIHIQRAEPDDPMAGPEGLAPAWKRAGSSVWVRCSCGYVVRLPHLIDNEDGSVEPSFVCPGCSWHAWLALEGWEASA